LKLAGVVRVGMFVPPGHSSLHSSLAGAEFGGPYFYCG
jgi:hypothetical protein